MQCVCLFAGIHFRDLKPGVVLCSHPQSLRVFFRFCELRQPGIGTGRHPVNERLPDRDEEAEGAAEALEERQQTLLKVSGGGRLS